MRGIRFMSTLAFSRCKCTHETVFCTIRRDGPNNPIMFCRINPNISGAPGELLETKFSLCHSLTRHGGATVLRSTWKRFLFYRDSRTGQGVRRRSLVRMSPACEALDGRQLLSGGPAATVALSAPPPTAVANAAAIPGSLAPTTFAQFQNDLARAERHSRVTQAQVSRLAQDEAAIDQAIMSRGLDSDTTSNDLDQVQDTVDDAFHPYLANGLVQKREVLEQLLPGVPGAHQLFSRTDAQILAVARAAGITGPYHNALSTDEQALTADLGPTPDTNLGAGATNRDPLEVYYNGQLDGFIK
jgi:hypothetical protein